MPKLVVFSGAGISAESGVPTFRDANGLWENHSIDVVCNIATWKSNFDVVHDFYNDRRRALSGVKSNAAHQKVAEWMRRYSGINLTQNIDDLLERAGCHDVTHLHGKLTEMRCMACGHTWDIGYSAWDTDDTCRSSKCQSRKGVKPNVVFFHEDAPLYARLYRTLKELRPDDVMVVIGTSSQVINIHGMLIDRPGTKILNVLEHNFGADLAAERVYDHTFFMPATEAAEAIDEVLRARLG